MVSKTVKKISIAAAPALLALALPAVGLALVFPTMPNPSGPLNILTLVATVLNLVWILFVAFAVIMFIIAGSKFLLAQGDPSETTKAKMFVIYGSVGIFVAILGFSIVWTIGAFFS